MYNYTIAVIAGDGIGPDIVAQTKKVLDALKPYGISFEYKDVLMGGCAIDATGVPLPQGTIDVCKTSDAVLLGAIGGYKWDNLPGNQRPEAGLLGIRSALGLYANLRPAKIHHQLRDASPLKPSLVEGVDFIIVRELTGGMYFGKRERGSDSNGVKYALDTEQYNENEVSRIARVGFELARKRGGNLLSVDKANVLESSRFWRENVIETAKDYPDIELSHMYVDNAAMQIVRRPAQFDVVVTSNIFGDILSDEASMVCGSIGMLPSASMGDGTFGLYEPIHGSAPDIAGKDIANPIGTILSAAMMLRYSLGQPEAAMAIEAAVETVLEAGYRTADICEGGTTPIGTVEMGTRIATAVAMKNDK